MTENKMTDRALSSFRVQFKAVVLQHIDKSLDADEWSRLRAMSTNRSRYVQPSDEPALEATPDALFEIACSEDNISVHETLAAAFMPVVIGSIEGQPVYYAPGQGFYLWGQEPDGGMTLAFWLTHPAYPPNW